MPDLYLYNTLKKKKELFKPLANKHVGLYTCGPTVYNYAHIGNLRTYLFEDFLKRVLQYNKFNVKHIMNITDVGHLTGDMDMGEDKMEKGAQREGKTAWQIAEYYTGAFKEDLKSLNILEPDLYPKVTDHIQEQIDLIVKLEKKGYTYKTSDGLYFDTSKIKNYNKLSHLPLETLKEGARVEKNREKKNPTDFALWKFSPANSQRQMEWNSPWGTGFPGWHIECSALALKYLGKNLDIHCGGADHINIHHTNEIAQSEAATGKPFFNYWLHGAFLNIRGGKKMAKSDNNFLTLKRALVEKKLSPLVYRFAASQVHYRKPMEYSEENFRQAEKGLNKLYEQVSNLGQKVGKVNAEFKDRFTQAVNDDLNMPKALAILASVLKSKMEVADKLATVYDFDKVLGLRLTDSWNMLKREDANASIPSNIQQLAAERIKARLNKDWAQSDSLRDKIRIEGYIVEDTPDGQKLKRS